MELPKDDWPVQHKRSQTEIGFCSRERQDVNQKCQTKPLCIERDRATCPRIVRELLRLKPCEENSNSHWSQLGPSRKRTSQGCLASWKKFAQPRWRVLPCLHTAHSCQIPCLRSMKRLYVLGFPHITCTAIIGASRLRAGWVGRCDFLPLGSNNTFDGQTP